MFDGRSAVNRLPAALLLLVSLGLGCLARGEEAGEHSTPENIARRWAVVVVGLSGDEQHEQLFRATRDAWQQWLVERLGYARDHVLVLEGQDSPSPATRESVRQVLARLAEQLGPDDSLWLLTLGHGNYDGHRGYLHLPGPDLDDRMLAEWLEPLRSREQVLWLTHSCSGWFAASLAREGRVVITATAADQEVNATEFPHALADVALRPREQLDTDRSGTVSLLELLIHVVATTRQRFAMDDRLETEHAQLDDDGDGRLRDLTLDDADAATSEAAPLGGHRPSPSIPGARDGKRAAEIQVPFQDIDQPAESSSSASPH